MTFYESCKTFDVAPLLDSGVHGREPQEGNNLSTKTAIEGLAGPLATVARMWKSHETKDPNMETNTAPNSINGLDVDKIGCTL